MNKFELKESNVEIGYKNRREIVEGCSLDIDQNPRIIKAFDNKEDAIKELQNYKTNITELSGVIGTYYDITEFYVEENIYDEDGEFISNEGIHEFSKIEIEVIEKPSYITVGTYDNFHDAEEKLYELEEGFLSFK